MVVMKLLGVEMVREESRCVCSEDSGAKQSIAKGSSLKEGGVKEHSSTETGIKESCSTKTGIKECSTETGIKESCSTKTGIKESCSTETDVKESSFSAETGIKESCPYEGVSNNEESSFDTTLTLLIGGKEVCVVKVEGKIVKSSFFIHIVEK